MSSALPLRHVTTVFLALSLAACGGDGDGNTTTPPPPDPDPTPAEITVGGTVVVPADAQGNPAARARVRAAMARANAVAAANAACPDVPVGYAPVANAAISFTTEDGQTSGVTAQTDQCGVFSAQVPDNIAFVIAKAAGYKDMRVPVTTFNASAGSTPPVLSILPDVPDAGYEIASMQWTNNKLYFTIVDTLTNKAVLGIPQTAISYSLNGAGATGLKSLAYATSQVDGNATVAVALDASGSMSSTVYDSNGNAVQDDAGRNLNAFRMTARAAHTFLDGKGSNDEVGFVVFDHDVNWIDQAFLAQRPMVTGPADAPVAYPLSYSDTGFDSNADKLRLAVDQYNPHTAFWSTGNNILDPLHSALPPTLRLSTRTYYPWNGSTAAYSAADLAREKVVVSSNARKLVVLMSDGADNASSLDADTLIANFKQDKLPLWTVAFGSNVSETTLKRIADETGGHYISSVDQSQLEAEFAAMQTGILFQYIAELQQSSLPANTTLKVNLDFGSLSATRSVVLQ